MNAKELWINLFDISLEKYRTEDSNIRNMAMLLHVFRLEFEKVSNYINDLQQQNDIQSKTIKNYELELKNCKCKTNIRSPLKTLTENKISPKINQTNLSVEQIDDVFNDHISEVEANISKENDGSLFIDDSYTAYEPSSPTFNRNKRSRSFRSTSRNQSLNNSTVIQGTPILRVNKVKKFKQSKLPSSFSKTVKNKQNCDDTDATFFASDGQIPTNNLDKSGENIDDILNEINCVTPSSKKYKLDNSYDCLPSRNSSPKFEFRRENVRKKNERLQMQGWECQDCEKYYKSLNLPEEELKKRMNQCSKHREHFNPIRLTPEGFWNPEFTPTQSSFAFEL